ncbi:MAG: GNAT family N-acetyltransferase [Deltaproteobacteria bacterium]|nr:GNAT family N-acetyltransferase [Deltaproteobacteria bacterium]
MDLKIRNADVDDAAFLAWLILTAGRAHVGRGIWEVILNQPEEYCLNFLRVMTVTGDPHPFHYSCYLVAEAAEGPVSGLGGYDPDTQGYPKLMEALPEVFRKLGTPPGELAAGKTPRITASIPPALPGAWVIDSVATLPAFRRKGIVDRLLDHILASGRKKGYRRAQISIYLGNTPAQRAYEKHGFRLLDEWPDPYFAKEIGSPGMARLIRDL